MGTPRLLLVISGTLALVIAAIAVLALESWVAFAIAIAAHAIGTVVVLVYTARRVAGKHEEDPDAPTPEHGRLEGEDGVRAI
jgi:membrane protein implicated in regulation of membrane protease activity